MQLKGHLLQSLYIDKHALVLAKTFDFFPSFSSGRPVVLVLSQKFMLPCAQGVASEAIVSLRVDLLLITVDCGESNTFTLVTTLAAIP